MTDPEQKSWIQIMMDRRRERAVEWLVHQIRILVALAVQHRIAYDNGYAAGRRDELVDAIALVTNDLAAAREECGRMRAVYEAANEWHRQDRAMEHGNDPASGERFRLAWDALNAAVDAALTAEGKGDGP